MLDTNHCTIAALTTITLTTLHCTQLHHNNTNIQVDLGASARIDHIKVWNRCDVPQDASLDADLYSKRLFPAWIIVADAPFASTVGGDSLRAALSSAKARCKLTEAKRCSVWRLPEQSNGRYIRVQIEGFDFLHLAEVQVLGHCCYCYATASTDEHVTASATIFGEQVVIMVS
jgi:hypothetical protein